MFPWLVPTERCVNNCDDATVAVALAMSLPEVNRLVLSYLIRFLQVRMCRASQTHYSLWLIYADLLTAVHNS